MNIIQQIERTAAYHTDARRAIALTILAHRNDLYTLSLQDLADLSFTSKPTVVRFTQSFGYQGWKDFRKDYIACLQKEKDNPERVDVNYPFDENSSLEDVAASIAQVMKQSVENTKETLDLDMVNRTVNLIERARRIIIYCVSPNVYAANLFARKMMTIQLPVFICQPREMGITVRSMSSRDLAIIISYAGNNPQNEPMKICDYLIENKIPTVILTGASDNYLRQHFGNVLTIASDENYFTKIATFATEESINYILNVIFAACFARHFKENDANKIHTSKFLELLRISGIEDAK